MVRHAGVDHEAAIAVGPAQVHAPLVVVGSLRREIARALLQPGVVKCVVQLSLP